MKYLNKISSIMCSAALGLLVLTGCEGADLYGVTAPDWISEKVDSIANANQGQGPTLSPLTLGATDNSDAFWASHLDADIMVPSKKIYTIGFTNYSSGANNWNNFYVVLRSADKATEYAVLRADDYGWGDGYSSCTHSNTGSADWGAWLAAMNGAHVTVSVSNYGDNTADVIATMEATDGNTYVQSYIGIPVESSNLYLDFTTDGNHYVFDKAEIDVEEAVDQQPVSMELVNVPDEAEKGSSLEDFVAGIKANVTYDGGAVREVSASNLSFITVPDDLNSLGEKYLVATLNKTLFGKAASNTVYASAKFNVVSSIKELTITKAPDHTTYYFYNSDATDGIEDRMLAFDPTGLEVVATYSDGTSIVIDHSKLNFSNVPAAPGTHKVTISSANGKTVETEVKVAVSKSTKVTPSTTIVGAEDNSTGWWGAHAEDINVPAGETREINFTNYTNGGGNWNNWVAILRRADLSEFAVVRADNYGWCGAVNSAAGLGELGWVLSGGQEDWATWLAAMNGAKCTLYVTNCNNGRSDIQCIMHGTDGMDYIQYYLNIAVDPNDLFISFTVDGCHLVFE